MRQTDIPCILMRGGTSRAPYFNAADLPRRRETLTEVLVAAMGAGSPLQVDGIGGAQPTTSKVAMLSPSSDGWAEVDFFFAQVHTERGEVDFSPSCGNILSGVGPAALEMGLVDARDGETPVRIRNTNTGAFIEAIVQTPDRQVRYDGDARIDGVPGTAAPVILNFMNVVGSKTGALFPTGRPVDVIDETEITCMDVAVPMVFGRAADFGLSGTESREEIEANRSLFDRLEAIRLIAGERMGLGDVTHSVVPRCALLAPPRHGGAVTGRYFTPWTAHPSYAVTGAICTGACLLSAGTIAADLARVPDGHPVPVRIEHVSGVIDVLFDVDRDPAGLVVKSAGLLRTARKLMSGVVSIPGDIWR